MKYAKVFLTVGITLAIGATSWADTEAHNRFLVLGNSNTRLAEQGGNLYVATNHKGFDPRLPDMDAKQNFIGRFDLQDHRFEPVYVFDSDEEVLSFDVDDRGDIFFFSTAFKGIERVSEGDRKNVVPVESYFGISSISIDGSSLLYTENLRGEGVYRIENVRENPEKIQTVTKIFREDIFGTGRRSYRGYMDSVGGIEIHGGAIYLKVAYNLFKYDRDRDQLERIAYPADYPIGCFTADEDGTVYISKKSDTVNGLWRVISHQGIIGTELEIVPGTEDLKISDCKAIDGRIFVTGQSNSDPSRAGVFEVNL